MDPASEDRQLGEYRLKPRLAESPISQTWLAEQTSVARMVLVDELCDDSRRQAFLADIRAKAAVDHPLLASVYEAVAEPDSCFYAYELLPGVSLADRFAQREHLSPARVASILRRVSEANLQLETLGLATQPCTLDTIFLDQHHVIRLKNLVVAGARVEGQSTRDISRLGRALVPLVATGKPGTTRMLLLLGWMRGQEVDEPLTWGQTRDTCMQIEHQLADPLSLLSPTQAGQYPRHKQPIVLLSCITALVLVGIGIFALKVRPSLPPPLPRASLPPAILIQAGSYMMPDGDKETLCAFKISAHEVTIAEYEEFLEILATLAKNHREDTFDHADQPEGKSNLEPAEWITQLTAAKSPKPGSQVTLDTPVVGVDWWDATAYAEWKKARLPTQEEWFAALEPPPAALPSGAQAPVTALTGNRSSRGLLGMAGPVREWTSKPAADPANPLGEKLWIIIGGADSKAGRHSQTREWTPDRSRRRADLGFRVVFDSE